MAYKDASFLRYHGLLESLVLMRSIIELMVSQICQKVVKRLSLMTWEGSVEEPIYKDALAIQDIQIYTTSIT